MRIGSVAGLAAALTATAVAPSAAPTAHATPIQDQLLYNLMASQGMYPASSTVFSAHQVCAAVWQGVNPWTKVSDVWYATPTFTWENATQFVGDAIMVYCPPSNDASSNLVGA
jgi:hypothetical protein